MIKHGGVREGAGRPPTNGKKHSIYLSDRDWELLKEIGDGNASRAIHDILIPGQCPKCGTQIEMLELA